MTKTLRIILFILFSALIIIDVILVFQPKDGHPTFSMIVREHRTSFIWLTFLCGGLISKIYFNKKTYNKKEEVVGLVAYLAVLIILIVIGNFVISGETVSTPVQLALLISGGLFAHLLWPQYQSKEQA